MGFEQIRHVATVALLMHVTLNFTRVYKNWSKMNKERLSRATGQTFTVC